MKYFYYYLIFINITGFVAVLSDKIRARFSWKRLNSKKFLFTSFLGAGVGILLGMHLLKHMNGEDMAYARRIIFNMCIAWAIGTMLLYSYMLIK
ncbi:MAG: DUF1294 domain-containing protein [Syntrophomonas sp.]|nr:DUF1294 domain-containing protein [Syntrophomonas sp.]